MKYSKMTNTGGYCPRCGVEWEMEIRTSVKEAGGPPDLPAKSLQAGKPPEKEDWVVITNKDIVGDNPWAKPFKVRKKSGDYCYLADGPIGDDSCWCRSELRIVRRSDAPLQKGDRGLLDGKIEVWIRYIGGRKLQLIFSSEELKMGRMPTEEAWIRPDRFTLTEPVYPDDEKLSGKPASGEWAGKEKED